MSLVIEPRQPLLVQGLPDKEEAKLSAGDEPEKDRGRFAGGEVACSCTCSAGSAAGKAGSLGRGRITLVGSFFQICVPICAILSLGPRLYQS